MRLVERKLAIVIDSNLGDLTIALEQTDLELNNIARKGKANGWTAKQIAERQILELEALKNFAKKASSGAIQSSSVLGNLERDSKGDLQAKFVWTATGSNVCPTCTGLHGTVKTYEGWATWGIPGTAPTLCTVNCVCELIEEKDAIENPIIVKRGKKGIRGGRGKIEAMTEKKTLVTPE